MPKGFTSASGKTAKETQLAGKTAKETLLAPKAIERKRESSLVNVPWTPAALAIKERWRALWGSEEDPEVFSGWVALTVDEKFIKDHPFVPVPHFILGVPLPRFKAIVKQRPGQPWATHGTKWGAVFKHLGFEGEVGAAPERGV